MTDDSMSHGDDATWLKIPIFSPVTDDAVSHGDDATWLKIPIFSLVTDDAVSHGDDVHVAEDSDLQPGDGRRCERWGRSVVRVPGWTSECPATSSGPHHQPST
ncbi:MAG TPA: hypothetical protein VMT00_13625 [Thermoanaerobaculia bacterium]|nr:hypothetical protein [Thermoanaerobaculia bacterium]